MSNRILITGAGGEVGSVSATIIQMLIAKGHQVRAFVRVDDHRAENLRRLGAEIFVGDLLNIADARAALEGCNRVYFSMSLSPYYLDATLIMAAAAQDHGKIEVFVNISEFEQSFMTADKMMLSESERSEYLGGLVTQWSDQQRAHWLAEKALAWSGLPVVNIQAAIFVENPILTWFTQGDVMQKHELRLPFGEAKLAPIVAYDVAEVCAIILDQPVEHIGKSYALLGGEEKDMHGLAEDFSAVLGEQIKYVPQDLESWNTDYIDAHLLKQNPHVARHLKTLTRLVASSRYGDFNNQLETLLGRPPKTIQWALARHPRLQLAHAK